MTVVHENAPWGEGMLSAEPTTWLERGRRESGGRGRASKRDVSSDVEGQGHKRGGRGRRIHARGGARSSVRRMLWVVDVSTKVVGFTGDDGVVPEVGGGRATGGLRRSGLACAGREATITADEQRARGG